MTSGGDRSSRTPRRCRADGPQLGLARRLGCPKAWRALRSNIKAANSMTRKPKVARTIEERNETSKTAKPATKITADHRIERPASEWPDLETDPRPEAGVVLVELLLHLVEDALLFFGKRHAPPPGPTAGPTLGWRRRPPLLANANPVGPTVPSRGHLSSRRGGANNDGATTSIVSVRRPGFAAPGRRRRPQAASRGDRRSVRSCSRISSAAELGRRHLRRRPPLLAQEPT